MTPELQELCALAGVRLHYVDQTGRHRETGAATAVALLSAMGLPAATEGEVRDTLDALRAEVTGRPVAPHVVVETDRPALLPLRGGHADWALTLEDGRVLEGHAEDAVTLPPLPAGIHRLDCAGHATVVLAAPPSLPPPPRSWGVTLPLYGLRTAREGGLGTYGDLAHAVRALGGRGAGFVGINPVHAGFFPDATEYSPYAPSHRRRLSAAHVEVPGEVGGGSGALIDYPRAYAARRAALDAAFASRGDDPAFNAYFVRGGEALRLFALHQALSERHGPFWRDWPAAFRDPESPEVARFAAEAGERLRYHAWLQYMAETQLGEATAAARDMAFGLYLDVAVGTHPFGAETWLEPGTFARGVSLGAPPDAFATDGQVWGLAPLDPRALVRSAFRPVAEMLRQQFRFSKLVRIDHILGFDRAFWVPEDRGLPGAYVTMPKDALLAVARIEAARAGGTIVGEDLGNIPEGLQADLDASGLLGCRVVMFELNDHGRARGSGEYPERTLASFGTHDLPTLAGWAEARDIGAREALGHMTAEAAAGARAHRAWEVAQLSGVAGGIDAGAVERFLAGARSGLVALQIEDILEITDQPNLPGTVAEYPNWRRRLPLAPEEIGADPRLARAVRTMTEAGR